MKIQLKKVVSTSSLISALKQTYPYKEGDKYVMFLLEKEAIIPREWSKLSRTAFLKVCRSIRVEGGIKLCSADEIIIKPKRNIILKIRVSAEECKSLEKAAKLTCQSLAEFIRDSALHNAEKLRRGKNER